MKGAEHDYNYIVVDAPLHWLMQLSKHRRYGLPILHPGAHTDSGRRVLDHLKAMQQTVCDAIIVACFRNGDDISRPSNASRHYDKQSTHEKPCLACR